MPHKTIIRLSGVARNPANGFPARPLAKGSNCLLATYVKTSLASSIRRGTLEAHRAPSHISKMVLSIVKIGPPNWTKSRTFILKFKLAL